MNARIRPLLLLAALASGACSTAFEKVPVRLPEQDVTRLDQYPKILYVDFLTTLSGIDEPAIAPVLRGYVTRDLAAALGKPIEPLEVPYWEPVRQVLQRFRAADGLLYDNNRFFAGVYRRHPRALFLVGKLNLDVKSVSTIGQVRDASGRKRSDFIAKRFWQMDLQVQLIDADTQRTLLKSQSKEKMDQESGDDFQFTALLDRSLTRFSAAVQRRERQQQRTILYR